MWQIVIFMLVATSDDAMVITHRNGKLLEFPTQQICRQHVTDNLDFLKNFASAQFDGAVVGGIDCFHNGFRVKRWHPKYHQAHHHPTKLTTVPQNIGRIANTCD